MPGWTGTPGNVVQRRPAETGTLVAGAVAYFIYRIFDLTAEDLAYLTILVAFVPTAITWIVNIIRKT